MDGLGSLDTLFGTLRLERMLSPGASRRSIELIVKLCRNYAILPCGRLSMPPAPRKGQAHMGMMKLIFRFRSARTFGGLGV